MRIIRSIKEMQDFTNAVHRQGKKVGFVPTMGALHAGHLSLIRKAGLDNHQAVVSIFVNPLQFGPKEDYRRYPRNLTRDVRLIKKEGVGVIFYPQAQQMYPDGYKTKVEVLSLSDTLCGKFRPGHFQGVATVVLKLFNIIRPDSAYFGQKDAQQAMIVRKMAQDLNLPLKIEIMPTVREKDGLAMSSRNMYLSPEERRQAVVLYRALRLAKDSIKRGNKGSADIIRKMRQLIHRGKSAQVQYISIVDLKDLKPVKKVKGPVLIALAAWIGKTRLIDNIIVTPSY